MTQGLGIPTESDTSAKGRCYYLASDSGDIFRVGTDAPITFRCVERYLEATRAPAFHWPSWTPSFPTLSSKPELQVLHILSLSTCRLTRPLQVVIQSDDEGYITRSPEFPQVYGFGDNASESLSAFRHELESLHSDLQEDDNFTPDWLPVKRVLSELVGD